jgi:ferredoxin
MTSQSTRAWKDLRYCIREGKRARNVARHGRLTDPGAARRFEPTCIADAPVQSRMSHRVHVLPADLVFEAKPGQTVFEAARRAGVIWPTLCNGKALCGLCWCTVESGADRLSPMDEMERQRLEMTGRLSDSRARLACQAKVIGNVVLSRRSVRRAVE